MSTETGTPAPSPLRSLLRQWPLAVALCLVGALLGFVLGGLLPSTKTAEARVAVGPGDMSAGAIAGFPEATREMSEDYARWVTSMGNQGQNGAKVSASPVPESNVIRVEAESGDAEQATQAAQQAAQQLVTSVNEGRSETSPQQTLTAITDLSGKWSASATELDRAEWEFNKVNEATTSTSRQYDVAAAALTKARTAESVLRSQLEAQQDKYKKQVGDSSASADLRLISNAAVAGDTAGSLRQRYAILGLALGLLLALVLATLRDRRTAEARPGRAR